MLSCQVAFHRCTFSACGVVVTGSESAAARFHGCTFTDTNVPAVIASGPAATVEIGSGPRGERTLFQNCVRPLIVARGGTSHVTECDVKAACGDCFSASGPSTRLTVEDCTVDGYSASTFPAPSPADQASHAYISRATQLQGWGVRLCLGANATVRGCRFEASCCGAIRVDSGALASVSDCASIAAGEAAFCAYSAARLHLHSCRSGHSIRAAVLAHGAQTEIHATNFKMNFCAWDGIVLQAGARVWLRSCEVWEARDAGLQVAGPGSHVWVEDCEITASGRSGVIAVGGGAAELRGSSVSFGTKCGMHAVGPGSSVNAAGCTICGNHEVAVSVCDGGRTALSNCTMEANASGCWVRGGGKLSANACRSDGEAGSWLSVSGAGSTAAATGCTVERAASSAVLVAEGATVQLYACALVQVACHAVIVRDPGSLLDAAHCTITGSGVTSVLVEHGGTALMHDTTVSSSKACGVESRNHATVGMDACIVQDCADVCMRVSLLATAVARACMFSSAANGGIDADSAGDAVLLSCTLDATGVAGVVVNGEALVAAFACVASGMAFDYVLREGSLPVCNCTPWSDVNAADDGWRDSDENDCRPGGDAGRGNAQAEDTRGFGRQRRTPKQVVLLHQDCRRVREGTAERWDGVAAPAALVLSSASADSSEANSSGERVALLAERLMHQYQRSGYFRGRFGAAARPGAAAAFEDVERAAIAALAAAVG